MDKWLLEWNGFQARLPKGLPPGPDTGIAWDAYQDFLEKGTRLLEPHILGMMKMIPPYVGDTQMLRVLHPFGGLGVTAQIIDQAHVKKGKQIPDHQFWERDPTCVQYLKSEYGDKFVMQVKDSYELLPTIDMDYWDMIVVDPSASTIKNPGIQAFWRHTIKFKRKPLIWLCDTAVGKLHLNYKSYMQELGVEVPNIEEYVGAYDAMLRAQYGYAIYVAKREDSDTYMLIGPDLRNQVPFPIERLRFELKVSIES